MTKAASNVRRFVHGEARLLDLSCGEFCCSGFSATRRPWRRASGQGDGGFWQGSGGAMGQSVGAGLLIFGFEGYLGGRGQIRTSRASSKFLGKEKHKVNSWEMNEEHKINSYGK